MGSAILILLAAVIWLKTKPTDTQVTIAFGGDTMLGRLVSDTLMRMESSQRCSYLWGDILPVINKADLRIINLETTFTTSNEAVPKVFNFKADPAMVACLQKAAIDVVSIANNHILDFGIQGLVDTLKVLDNAHITHVGAGLTIDDARKPVILEKKGIRIGVLGYTDNEPTWLAGVTTPGTNYIKVGDRSQLTYITQLKQHVDIVVVTIHWGPNMREYPTEEFRNFAHAMIDAGADIIHGHSAHIVQPIERYRDKLIMYDTGDFVDDYAVDPQLRNDLSFIFLITIDKSAIIKNIDLVPTKISMMQVNTATGSDRTWLEKRMKMLSTTFT